MLHNNIHNLERLSHANLSIFETLKSLVWLTLWTRMEKAS